MYRFYEKRINIKINILLGLITVLISFTDPSHSFAACRPGPYPGYVGDVLDCDTEGEAVAAAAACCAGPYSSYPCGCEVRMQYNAYGVAIAALTFSPFWTGYSCEPSHPMESMRAFGIVKGCVRGVNPDGTLKCCPGDTDPCCNNPDPCCRDKCCGQCNCPPPPPVAGGGGGPGGGGDGTGGID